MSKRNDLLVLHDIIEAIENTGTYLHGMRENDFYNDRKQKMQL
jgi:uncharacterized protein with HEPN domain